MHERSFENLREAIDDSLDGSFKVGTLRFVRLNVLAEARPDTFLFEKGQFAWPAGEPREAEESNETSVTLMHCQPSEFGQGVADALRELLRCFDVRLVEMGTLTTTRSATMALHSML